MKMNIKAISTKLLVLAFGIGALTSCISDKDSPGLDYMPDMYRSPAIEPYVDYGWIKERTDVELTMKQSAMHPPVGTVPYKGDIEDLEIYLPYQRKVSSFAYKTHSLEARHGWKLADDAFGEYSEAAEDVNPVKLSADNEEEIFEKGEKLYTINCAHCHGATGDGQGPMVQSGAYAGVPDYKNLKIADGQMFYSIYYGRNMMGAHAQFLNNYEIWTVIHYINKLQDGNYGASAYNKKVAAAEATSTETEETEEA